MDENIDVSVAEFPNYITDCIKDLDSQVTELYSKIDEILRQMSVVQATLKNIK